MARLAGRDIRSNFGSNLRLIAEKTCLDPWVTDNVTIKNKLNYVESPVVPDQDVWRLGLLEKLLAARLMAFYENREDDELQLNDMINSLTIN